MISPSKRFASPIERSVLPDPVGPVTTTTGGRDSAPSPTESSGASLEFGWSVDVSEDKDFGLGGGGAAETSGVLSQSLGSRRQNPGKPSRSKSPAKNPFQIALMMRS